MLSFYEDKYPDNSDGISSTIRRWATNADDYICWDLIPSEAFIAFVPYRALATNTFLTQEFIKSIYLSDIRRISLEAISLKSIQIEYQDLCKLLSWRSLARR